MGIVTTSPQHASPPPADLHRTFGPLSVLYLYFSPHTILHCLHVKSTCRHLTSISYLFFVCTPHSLSVCTETRRGMLATDVCRDTQSQTICTTYATVASSCSTYHCALLGRGVRRFAQVVSVLCAYKERYSFGQDDFSQYHLPFDVQFIVIIFCFIFVVFLLFLFFFCYDLTMSYTLRLSCR